MDELGTDALRFTLLVGSTPGNDISLSVKKVEANRNFANKIWNAARLILTAIGKLAVTPAEQQAAEADPDWTLADSWAWARLQNLVREVERLFQSYQYGEAGRQIYEYFWSEFADWYLEAVKLQLEQGGKRAYTTAYGLARILDTCLRLLHPFTPFITEELWGRLKQAVLDSPLAASLPDWPEALIVAPFPAPRPVAEWEAPSVEDFSLVQEVVRAIRNLRAEKNLKPAQRLPAILVSASAAAMLQDQSAVLAALAGLDSVQLQILPTLEEKPAGHMALVAGPVEIFLPLVELVDAGEERQRLAKSLAETEAQVTRLQGLLASDFAHKAPPAVVQKERERLAAFEETREKLKKQLETLG